MGKKYLNIDVYSAAKQRIKETIDNFDDFYVSFSGGKDSGVLLEMVIEVAREMGRLPVKAVFSDLELIFKETVDYVVRTFDRETVQGYWLCLEELDENSSSAFEYYFKIWDKSKKDKWVHQPPNRSYVITDSSCPDKLKVYLQPEKLEYWSVEHFGEYLCDELGVKSICNFIGMRGSESYGRYMCVKTEKNRTKISGYTYKTKTSGDRTFISLPIYDWEYSDIWHYYAIKNADYNGIYDKMLKLGLTYPKMRTCSALGEEQKKTLYYWKIFEPETFEKILQRVEGVNFGAIYNHTSIDRGKIHKPDSVTWKEYFAILIADIPKETKATFRKKLDVALRYHKTMYEEDCIYENFCNAVVKHDFALKKYGLGYAKKMSERVAEVKKKVRDL